MSEDEAKGKWCPLARVVAKIGDGEHVINRSRANKDHHTLCIGSACMAWRTWVKPTGVMTETVDGFCGLAGSPR